MDCRLNRSTQHRRSCRPTHPDLPLSGFLKTRILRALGRTFIFEGAHWGDSGVWLITRVRPTIAECEGVTNVSGADGSADDSFCGELVNDDWQVCF